MIKTSSLNDAQRAPQKPISAAEALRRVALDHKWTEEYAQRRACLAYRLASASENTIQAWRKWLPIEVTLLLAHIGNKGTERLEVSKDMPDSVRRWLVNKGFEAVTHDDIDAVRDALQEMLKVLETHKVIDK